VKFTFEGKNSRSVNSTQLVLECTNVSVALQHRAASGVRPESVRAVPRMSDNVGCHASLGQGLNCNGQRSSYDLKNTCCSRAPAQSCEMCPTQKGAARGARDRARGGPARSAKYNGESQAS